MLKRRFVSGSLDRGAKHAEESSPTDDSKHQGWLERARKHFNSKNGRTWMSFMVSRYNFLNRGELLPDDPAVREEILTQQIAVMAVWIVNVDETETDYNLYQKVLGLSKQSRSDFQEELMALIMMKDLSDWDSKVLKIFDPRKQSYSN